jgi:hypothetical protein
LVTEVQGKLHDRDRDVAALRAQQAATACAADRKSASLAHALEEVAAVRAQFEAEEAKVGELRVALSEEQGQEAGGRREEYLLEVPSFLPS